MENKPAYDLEKLDKYLSGELSASEMDALNEQISVDTEMEDTIMLLKVSRHAIRKEAISRKVKALHARFMVEREESSRAKKVVSIHLNRRMIWSIAASFLVAAIAYGLYQYSSTDTISFYNEKFVSYHLPVARGIEEPSFLLDSLYNKGHYQALVDAFSKQASPSPRHQFLAAMSQMQSGNFADAHAILEALAQKNRETGDHYFEQETEYYLALASIQTGDFEKAITLFEKIKQDKRHLYHHNVSSADLLRIKILKIKS
jgi:tetratricopeptide (TPR) repeat protein